MQPIKKNLAPTDLSNLSLVGIRYAFDLARSLGASITVYHVVNREEIIQYSQHLGELGSTSRAFREGSNLIDRYTAGLSRYLKENLAELLPLVEVQERVEMGVPYKNIVDRARIEDSDLIVMSTHGRTGLSHILLGSVTEKVVRTAPCPVISIHPEQVKKAAEKVAAVA